jgi:hypothetical protein
MIRVVLPPHLRGLARIRGEVELDLQAPVTTSRKRVGRSCASSLVARTSPMNIRTAHCLRRLSRERSPSSSSAPSLVADERPPR